MIINVFDAYDPAKLKSAKLVKDGEKIMLGGMCNGVAQMVTEIERICRDRCSLMHLLRVFGHGTQGLMGISIGHGRDPRYDPNLQSTIDATNFSLIEPDLKRLPSLFTGNASVELHGCSVGGGSEGDKLLQDLADLWGVKVKAGVHAQVSGTKSTQEKFEGSFKTASPNGTKPHLHLRLPTLRQIDYWITGD